MPAGILHILQDAMIPPLIENGFWLALIPGSTMLQNSDVPRPHVGTSTMRARILLISGKYYRLQ